MLQTFLFFSVIITLEILIKIKGVEATYVYKRKYDS